MSLRLCAATSIFICFAAVAGAPASADARESKTAAFRYQVDEFDAPHGIERVLRRLHRAAESACVSNGRKTLREAALERACHERLAAEFVDRIGDSRLSALHAQGADGYSTDR